MILSAFVDFRFENNDGYLELILEAKYPNGIFCKKCQIISKFYKVRSRPVYQCSCGYQIAPLSGTIFEKTRTPLKHWFYVFFICSSKKTVSAKHLRRELGVTYKTAWRMLKRIKNVLENAGGFEENDRLFTFNRIIEVEDKQFRLTG